LKRVTFILPDILSDVTYRCGPVEPIFNFLKTNFVLLIKIADKLWTYVVIREIFVLLSNNTLSL